VSWQKTIPFDQDIDMPKIAAMARTHQPGLLVVDRTVTGPYENYVTPEQQIPSHYMPIPWETCLTMGDSWSYIPKENFKPARKLIHILVDVVSKNGNLLLNIAPSPQGDFHPEAYDRLKEIGNWMNVNSEAIYGTTGDKDLGPQGKLVFTHKGKTVYAIYRADEGEIVPTKIDLKNLTLSKKATVNLLGNKDVLRWSAENGTTSIVVPEKTAKLVPNSYAYVFKITDF
jgi:alpha-L-fucosidase